MHSHLTAALSAAAIVAALGLSGCSQSESSTPSSTASPVASATSAPPLVPAPAPQAAPLPPPEALTDVLYRLADPAVPGAEKLNLVEGATADNAVTLDKFAMALKDGGYTPLAFDAADITWSDRDPADAVATVNVTTPNPDAPGFSFPMEFKPYQGGWQLSRKTADMLLAFGEAHTGTSATPTP